MKRVDLHRWTIQDGLATLLGDTAHRAARVLRVRSGETIVGTDGEGTEFVMIVKRILRDRVEATIVSVRRGSGESPLRITLAQAVPRGTRMDMVIQKATELGVNRIVPLVAARNVVKPGPGEGHRGDRWARIAAEAVAQSRRTVSPEVTPPRSLKEFLAGAEAESRCVLHPGPETVRLSALSSERPGSFEIVVGPEGGLEKHELEACLAAGFQPVTLGPRILRAETAGIVAVALVQHRWGDLD
jgi:16S rRNA (uracil1498-N3)-methyltransferase